FAGAVIWKQPGDVASLVERHRTAGPEIRVDLAFLQHVAERAVLADELERQFADRAKVHIIVRPPRLVGAALEPFDPAQIDAQIVLQNSSHPDAGCLAVFLNANTLALEVARLFDAGVFVYENVAVPEHPRR